MSVTTSHRVLLTVPSVGIVELIALKPRRDYQIVLVKREDEYITWSRNPNTGVCVNGHYLTNADLDDALDDFNSR